MNKNNREGIYRWFGINISGARISGEMNAIDSVMVKVHLLQQGIQPLKIYKPFRWQRVFLKAKPGKKHVQNFTQQLKDLMQAGIAILPALNIIYANTVNLNWRRLIADIKKQISAGQLLSSVLTQYPECFNALYCNLIAAGEQTSQLSLILEKILEYQEKIAHIKQKVQKAIFYPVIVLLFASLVTLSLCLFVIPQFEQMFINFNAQLPLLTRLVVAFANGLQHYGWLILVSGLLMGLILKWQHKKNTYWHKLPFIGQILKTAILARCLHTLTISLQAGITLPQALHIAAGIGGHPVYYHGMLHIQQEITAGERLHKAMESSGLFSLEVIQMVAVSEETGSLITVLQQITANIAAKVDNNLDTLTKLLEPAIMFILSVIVGIIITAMYLPIFRLGGVL